MNKTVIALKIIRDNEIYMPKEFARLMWPNSEGWKRVQNMGHGAHAGAGMYLAGGSFLGKLRKEELIWGGFGRDRIVLTDKGREVLKQADIPERTDRGMRYAANE